MRVLELQTATLKHIEMAVGPTHCSVLPGTDKVALLINLGDGNT